MPAIVKRLLWWSLFPLITGLMAWQWLVPLAHLPGPRGDSGQMVWNLWHVTEAIFEGRSPLTTTRVFYPVGANLATHTLAAGFFPITALVKVASGGDPLYPFYAYKLLVPLCFLLLLVFGYRFLRSLGAARGEALVPAAGYAFCDYYYHHASQLNLACGFLLPLNAWLALAAARKPTAGRIAASAFALGVTPYFGEYSVYLLLIFALFLLTMMARAPDRAILRSRLRAAGIPSALLGLLVFGLTVAPFWQLWWRARPLPVDPERVSYFSANLAGFIVPSPGVAPLYEALSAGLPGDPLAALAGRVSLGMGGFEVFAGFAALALGALGIARPAFGARRAALLALVFWILSLGPTLQVFATDTGLTLPFAWLHQLPPFDRGRTPVRFVAAAAFLWTIAAAAGVRAVTGAFAGRRRTAAVAALAAWTLAECWSPFLFLGRLELPVGRLREEVAPGPVLCVPIDGNPGLHASLQTLHGRPISSGYLARLDAAQAGLRERLRSALRDDPDPLARVVAELGYRTALITEPVPWFVYRRLTASSLEVVSVPAEPYPAASVTIFGDPPAAAMALGREIAFGRGGRGRYLLRQGWSQQEPWGTWSDGEEAVLVFHLEAAAVRPLVLELRARIFEGQEVSVTLRGEALENPASGPSTLRYLLPQRLLGRENRLVFRLPGARSPRDLDLGDDARRLGIGLEWMVLGEPGGRV